MWNIFRSNNCWHICDKKKHKKPKTYSHDISCPKNHVKALLSSTSLTCMFHVIAVGRTPRSTASSKNPMAPDSVVRTKTLKGNIIGDDIW